MIVAPNEFWGIIWRVPLRDGASRTTFIHIVLIQVVPPSLLFYDQKWSRWTEGRLWSSRLAGQGYGEIGVLNLVHYGLPVLIASLFPPKFKWLVVTCNNIDIGDPILLRDGGSYVLDGTDYSMCLKMFLKWTDSQFGVTSEPNVAPEKSDDIRCVFH